MARKIVNKAFIAMDYLEKQKEEIEFWKTSPLENPLEFTIENLVNKMSEAKLLLNKLNRYKELINNKNVVLELGGGQGWASCILKKYLLNERSLVINSDISKYAVPACHNWEYIFRTNLDSLVCKSYEIPLKSNSIDLLFTFQSAHHFIKHRSTIKEIYRILKPGGICLYLNEPSCRRYIYPLAYKRVNKKRTNVSEDVLVWKEILYLAENTGFNVTAHYDTSFINQNPLETIYYYILSKIIVFKYFLPCGMDYVFVKS